MAPKFGAWQRAGDVVFISPHSLALAMCNDRHDTIYTAPGSERRDVSRSSLSVPGNPLPHLLLFKEAGAERNLDT